MRERIYYQAVAGLTFAFLILFIATFINAQDIKPAIADALAKGDTALAISLLEKEIALDKSFHLNYYMLGMIYFERMQYRKAEEQFLAALDKKGKHSESQYQLGLTYLQLEELDKAEKIMDEGRKKDKKNAGLFEDGYGQVMMARENYQEADRAFRQALIAEPENPTYHIHLGDANFYQGVPAIAVMEYEKALQADTAGTEVYFHWAEACLEMKDYNCAIEKLAIVLSKDSTHAKAWMRAGGIYFAAGRSSKVREEKTERFKDAIGAYKKYLELTNATPDSLNVRVFFELATSYANLYGFEDAVENYDKVLSIPVIPKDIYFYYGKSLWGIKDYVRSGEMLLKHEEWLKTQNEDYSPTYSSFELPQLLGDSYYYRDDKDFAAAVEYYKKSLELNPEQKRIVQNTAVAYHSLKSYGQALEYYDKRIAMGIDSANVGIYKNAGFCALNIANNKSGGEDEIDIDGDMPTSSAPATEANVNYYQLAVDYMKKYLELQPDDTKSALIIASTYLYQLSDCVNGVKYFEMVLAQEPKNCEAKKSLGYAYFGGVCTKNYSKAINYLLEAHQCTVAEKGECGEVDLALWTAQCYHLRAAEKLEKKESANDDFKNAFNWYGKVLKCNPAHADAKKGQDDVRFEFAD